MDLIGLLLTNKIWHKLQNFYSGYVCLVLASDVYDEVDYIRDFNVFRSSKNRSA